MQDNFDTAFSFTVGVEGGFGKDRNDAGNWTGGRVGSGRLVGTKYGISAAAWGHLYDIPNLTLDQAKQIYRVHYWNACQCDQLPSGLDLVVFDGSVNSGVGDSAKWLQSAAGVSQDGVIGPKTLAAVAQGQVNLMIGDACDARLAFDKSLSAWKDYGNGWSDRIAKLRGAALAMVPANAPTRRPMMQRAADLIGWHTGR